MVIIVIIKVVILMKIVVERQPTLDVNFLFHNLNMLIYQEEDLDIYGY